MEGTAPMMQSQRQSSSFMLGSLYTDDTALTAKTCHRDGVISRIIVKVDG